MVVDSYVLSHVCTYYCHSYCASHLSLITQFTIHTSHSSPNSLFIPVTHHPTHYSHQSLITQLSDHTCHSSHCCDVPFADGTKEALDQWEVAKGKGKGKPLTATKSRKNKKPSSSPQSVLVNGELPNGYDHSLKNGLSASPVESMPSLKNVSNHDSHKVIHPPPLPQREHHKVDRHGDENKSKEQSTFADKKHLSGPNTLCVAEATVKPVPILASTDSGTHSDNPHIPPGEAGREKRQDSRGRLDSTASTGSASGSGDSTKRLMKDLTRCHVSLSRHQTNLNEVSSPNAHSGHIHTYMLLTCSAHVRRVKPC